MHQLARDDSISTFLFLSLVRFQGDHWRKKKGGQRSVSNVTCGLPSSLLRPFVAWTPLWDPLPLVRNPSPPPPPTTTYSSFPFERFIFPPLERVFLIFVFIFVHVLQPSACCPAGPPLHGVGGRVDLSEQGKFRALFNGSLERWSLLDYGGYLSLVYDLWIHWYRFRACISFDIFFLFFFFSWVLFCKFFETIVLSESVHITCWVYFIDEY